MFLKTRRCRTQSPKHYETLGEVEEAGPEAAFSGSQDLSPPLPCNMAILVWEPWLHVYPSLTPQLFTPCGLRLLPGTHPGSPDSTGTQVSHRSTSHPHSVDWACSPALTLAVGTRALGTELKHKGSFRSLLRSRAAKVKDKGSSPGLEPGQDQLLFSVWNSSWLQSSFSVGFSP